MNGGALILGLINGMLIGLLAVGIVLVYKANRFLNLAHAQLGALAAVLLAKLVIDEGAPWWLGFVVCVPIGAAVGMAVDRFVVRPLRARGASSIALLLVTIGVTQLLIGVSLARSVGPNQQTLSTKGYPLPFTAHVHVAGVILNGADITILILTPVLIVALTAFLRFTMLGKMIRAAASNPDAARLSSISPARISIVTWGIAGGLSAIAAILQSPKESTFDAATLGPFLLLLALGAAAFGAFTSIPGALAGGVLIGVAQQLALAQTSNAGISEVVVFAVILGFVFLRGDAIGKVFAGRGAVVDDRPPIRVPANIRDHPLVTSGRSALVTVVLAAALVAPFVPSLHTEGHRFQLALIAVYAVIALSLTVGIGWAGQVSLGQFGLVGAGAFVAARLVPHGWSIPLMLIVCGAAGAVIMLIVAAPAVRVPGLTLAVTTLGFAVVGPDWLFHQRWFGSTRSIGIDLNPPNLVAGGGHPASQLAVYYTALATVVVAAGALVAIRRAQPGRLIIAVRDNERRTAAFGVTPTAVKLMALGLSGFLAAAAGVLWADAWRSVNAAQFTPDLSLSVLAAPVIGGIGSVSGAIAGAVVVYGLTYFVGPQLSSVFGSAGQTLGAAVLFGGVGLILVLRAAPTGLAGLAHGWWQRLLDRMALRAEERPPREHGGSLVAEEVYLSFGGIVALDGAAIEVRPGEIVGLIGPNGAGKTTLMNVISGVLAPRLGRVWIGAHDVSGLPPELRYAHGLSRSFQEAHLYPGLTVREAMQVAMATRHRVGLLSSAVGAPWARSSEMSSQRAAAALLEEFGLTPWADTLTADLSTGTRRICDLAAQVAAAPEVLLLDEPTAGVAQREAEAFGPLLRKVRDQLDCSILIIEHDMPLLMGLCDRVYAMESGRVIAEGSPEEVRNNPDVIASYLGTDEAAIARSGRRRGARAARR